MSSQSQPALGVAYSSADPSIEDLPARVRQYPEFRYMGAKHRLLPWIHNVLSGLDFETALDPFCGTASVSYLLKSMNRRVVSLDFLNMAATIASASVANNSKHIEGPDLRLLLSSSGRHSDFISQTFAGVFFKPDDLEFLDRVLSNAANLDRQKRAVALSALMRSCLKKQPRGVFTLSGDLSRYDDGRRDLRLSIEEHFLEQIEVFNSIVFDNGRRNFAKQVDFFSDRRRDVDLVYLDPPYVPRSDDNCYVKRYHFLEGLSKNWEGEEIDHGTKVKKIKKKYTPFSYRRTAVEAFEAVFDRYKNSIVVLSYSSNGFPDLETLEELLQRTKRTVEVFQKPHRYHFGTHKSVKRSLVTEYLIVGRP